jgi:hypothetical protein
MFTLLLGNNVFLGEFSHCDNNKINIANSTKEFFGKKKNKKNHQILRKQSLKSFDLNIEFLYFTKTKQDSHIFLLSYLNYNQL